MLIISIVTGYHNVITFNDVEIEEGGIKVERGIYDVNFIQIQSYAGYRYGPLGPQNLSDERLKNIINKQINASDIINNINVKSFTYKSDSLNKEKLGFLAQQLYEILPDSVVVGGENASTRPWTVIMESLIPYLVKSFQELSAKVDELESRLV